MRDPGLDRHEWETEWEALEPDLETSPAETLSELEGLVARMLDGHGIPVGDDVAADGADEEIVGSFREAQEITRRVERGEDVDPGDVGAAVNRYRAIYRHLLTQPADEGLETLE